MQIIVRENKRSFLKNLLKENSTKFFSVDFLKADGSERTLSGNIRKVEGHNGKNTTSHLDEYVTIVRNTDNPRDRFRNVNLDMVHTIRLGGDVYKFK